MKEEIGSKNPLVTVGVLTYNSSRTVLETLDSIKAQSYRNIELVVSDDASTDNTVELCRKWISANKDRFVRCELLTVPKNTGIPANANRRLEAARGVWIKGVAADDLLAPDCVENFINYVNEHPEAEVIFAKYQRFKKEFSKENFERVYDLEAKWFCSKFKTPEAQYKNLLNRMYGHPLTVFAKCSVLKNVKYDENIPFSEDVPMWLRLSKSGVLFHFMDKIVAYYRLSTYSSSGNNDIRKNILIRMRSEIIRQKYIYPNIPFHRRLLKKLRYKEYKILEKMGLLSSKSGKAGYAILALIYYISSPQIVYYKFRNKLFRS